MTTDLLSALWLCSSRTSVCQISRDSLKKFTRCMSRKSRNKMQRSTLSSLLSTIRLFQTKPRAQQRKKFQEWDLQAKFWTLTCFHSAISVAKTRKFNLLNKKTEASPRKQMLRRKRIAWQIWTSNQQPRSRIRTNASLLMWWRRRKKSHHLQTILSAQWCLEDWTYSLKLSIACLTNLHHSQ